VTIVWNPRSKKYEADLRSTKGPVPRLHISLKTKSKDEADDRHAAVKALYKQGNEKTITALRKRRIAVEAVTRVHQAQQPFESLLQSAGWPTIEKATKDYLRWMEHQADKSEGTIQSARLLLGHAADHFGKDKTLDSISHEEIEEYKTKLIEGGVTAWTAELQLVRLRALYNWISDREAKTAQREKRGARSLYVPIDSEITQTKSIPRTRFLLEPEAKKVLAATPDSLLFLVGCGLLSGLRLDEVCHLQPPPLGLNFEVAGGVIVIPQSIDLGDDKVWRPKSRKRREIPMAAELLPIARRHAEKYASANWMCPHPRLQNRPLDKNILGAQFTRIVADAGLVTGARDPMGVTFHTLRHTFASWLVMAGVDLWTVAQLLGHSGIKLVEQTYGHLSPNHKRLAVDRLGTAYKLDLETAT
jgi:integrase